MNISSSITKRDHGEKMDGTALYVADYPTINVLFGKLLRSAKAHAKILDVKVPKLPEMYYFIDKDDVPGINRVHIVEDDITVFAEDTVEYIGDVIGMIVGPNEKEVQQLMDAVIVDYEELMPVVDMRDSKTIFFEYQYGKGNVEQAFEEADKIYEEQFETGYQ
ncbi:MAG: xanthine dehydrogenase family protein, partial [Lachnospiraceae bacterium]|nr:xanthine dehydrogenase family protein [Lachnospiraceae bacterium]